jgi:hypothetical protein
VDVHCCCVRCYAVVLRRGAGRTGAEMTTVTLLVIGVIASAALLAIGLGGMAYLWDMRDKE